MKKQGIILVIAVIVLCFGGIAFAEEAIKIGCLFDLSGPAGHIGMPSKYVAEMLADQINKSGGINGKTIKLIYGDSESNPGKAAIEAKRLVENERVDALIGPTRTDSCMAIINFIEKAQIPTVACVGGTPPVNPVRKWVFKSPQKTVTAVEKIYEYLKKQKIQKIAVINATDKFGQEGEESLNALADKYGITIVAQEKFEVSDVDMTVQLTKIKGTDAQALVCWTIGPPGSIVAKNVRQLSYTIPLIQCHGLPDPKYIELAGDAAEGTIMPSTKVMVADQLPDSDPQKKLLLSFINEYETVRKHGKVNAHSGYAWDALMLVAEAMKNAGADKVKIRDGIESIKNYIGISGIYTMTPEDHCGLGLDSMVMVRVQGKSFKLIE